MKKSDFILIGVIIIIAIVAFVSSKGNVELEKVEYPVLLSGNSGLNKITYSQYQEFVENGDAFIVVIERTGCSYCTMYMPIVEEVGIEKNIPFYYIDIAELSQNEFNNLNSTNDYLRKNPDWGTPTTLLMLGDRVLDSIGGYVEKDKLLSFVDGKVEMGE